MMLIGNKIRHSPSFSQYGHVIATYQNYLSLNFHGYYSHTHIYIYTHQNLLPCKFKSQRWSLKQIDSKTNYVRDQEKKKRMKGGGAIEFGGERNRGISIFDFVLRLLAFIATLGSAIAMATSDETLPFFTQFIRFRAEYDDLPTFTYVNYSFFITCNT